jgi:hypothetical protein
MESIARSIRLNRIHLKRGLKPAPTLVQPQKSTTAQRYPDNAVRSICSGAYRSLRLIESCKAG